MAKYPEVVSVKSRYKWALRDLVDSLCSEIAVPEGRAMNVYLATWKTPKAFRTNIDKLAIIENFEAMLRGMDFRGLYETVKRQTSADIADASVWQTVFAKAIFGYLKEIEASKSDAGESDTPTLVVEYPTDVFNEGNEYITAGAEGATRELASMHRERQAAYAAKNRKKAKALRRPDARAVADAYMASVEDARLINLIARVDEHIALSNPDTTLSGLPSAVKEERARAVIDYIRVLVGANLEAKGFDREQIRDKLGSMTFNGAET